MATESPWTQVKIYSSSFLFVFFFAAIASVGSAKAPEIYSRLLLPNWAPNPSLFGPVWACLYVSIAISLAIFRGRSNWRMHPLLASPMCAPLLAYGGFVVDAAMLPLLLRAPRWMVAGVCLAFHGFNATCFAYGQTSSGKSYSMVGRIPHGASAASKDVDPGVGIIPRVASLLFATVGSMPETHEFLVEGSFLEICE